MIRGELDFWPKAQISTPSSARGRQGRPPAGTGDARLDRKLEGTERNEWYEVGTFHLVSVSSLLFPILNPKLQKKACWDSADPGSVTHSLTLKVP